MESFVGSFTVALFIGLLWFTVRLPSFPWVQRIQARKRGALPDLRDFSREAHDDLHWHEPLVDLHPDEEAAIRRARVVLRRG